MLRITVQSNLAAAKNYFKQATHDYMAEGERELPGRWSGKGAKMLGLEGDIEKADWDYLCENTNPQTGERLTSITRDDRRIFYDATYSMPKSASLASLFDDRIIPAFERSVEFANRLIEDDMRVRVRDEGKDEDRTVGNAIIGSYLHTDGRPVDGIPDRQVHIHSCFFNAAFDPVSDKWKAAQLGDIKANAGFYEQVALAHFAKQLVDDMGYGIRRKGRYFELEHVSDAVVDKFSNRKKLIEAVAEERGITNPDYKAELGGKTRERKQTKLTEAELFDLWVSRLTQAEIQALKSQPGQEADLPTVEESARFAIDHAFYNEAVRPTKKVLEEGLRHGVGRVTLDELRLELDQAGLLTKGERSTTQEMLDLEAGMVRFARDTKGVYEASVPKEVPKGLNRDQRKGVEHIWRSHDGVTAVRGAAGVGKTYALRTAADGIREAGFAVQALAQSNTAVKELIREGVDANARTITSFLMSEKAQTAARGATIFVDESSLVGTVEMAKLFQVVERIEARVVLVGDEKQHGAVSAGAPVRLLRDFAGIEPVEITEILRQQDLQYRLACEKFADHDILGGMDDLRKMGCIHEISDEFRTEALVLDYMAETRAKRDVLVVSPTHAEAKEVTDGIRDALKKDGKLKGEEKEFDRLVNLNWTEAERLESKKKNTPQAQRVKEENLTVTQYGVYRPEKLSVAIGDSLRATGGFTDANGHRVTNGMRFKATGFSGKGIKAESESGIKLVIPADAKHFAHNYVTTSFGSQGRTADVVLVSESTDSFPAADRAQIYVSASRARHAVRIYTDDALALRDAVDRDRVKENAHDLLDHNVQPHEKVNPIKERAMFVSRTQDRSKEQVIQLTKVKEKTYDLEIER